MMHQIVAANTVGFAREGEWAAELIWEQPVIVVCSRMELGDYLGTGLVMEAADSIAAAVGEDNIEAAVVGEDSTVAAAGQDSVIVERLGTGFELQDIALVAAGRIADVVGVADYFSPPAALSVLLCPC
jgi:hypothetical protein